MRTLKLSRRTFLHQATRTGLGAVAMPYVITSTALGSGSTPPASGRITLGHIGVGGQGSGLLTGFLGVKGCQSIAVCDAFLSRQQQRAKEIEAHYAELKGKGEYKGCTIYEDFRELLARPDIDAVIVATPDHWHVPIGVAAARAGKDMYVEKPLGLSIEQDKAMRSAVHRYGRIFQYGTQQRSFNTHCAFACELVRNGYLGRIKEIHVLAPEGASGGSTDPIQVPEGFNYDQRESLILGV